MTKSGFDNDAADKIWNDHIGRNAFVLHRDQCPVCQASCDANSQFVVNDVQRYRRYRGCDEGERIFEEVLDKTLAEIDEVMKNQN